MKAKIKVQPSRETLKIASRVYPLSWIPNKPGFKFLGIRIDGTVIDCEVEGYAPEGYPEVELCRIKGVKIRELSGWMSIDGNIR